MFMQQKEIRNWVFRVLKRILIEFSLPAIAATIWYIWSGHSGLSGWGIFIVSSSWVSSQIFKIIKQQRVEGEFDLVKSRLGHMLERIEDQTRKVVGYSTGSNSNGFILPVADNQDQVRLFIVNESEFPCYQVRSDIHELTDDGKTVFLHERTHEVLYPEHWYSSDYTLPFFPGRKKFKVYFQTRVACTYVQYILIERVRNKYLIAYTKWVNGKIHYVVPDNFPGYDPRHPEALFADLSRNGVNSWDGLWGQMGIGN